MKQRNGYQKRTILLTGGSGVLGHVIIERFSDATIIALERKHPLKTDKCERVIGDIRKPQLGMDADTYSTLVKRVDAVIHSAAITDFASSYDVVHEANVVGTQNVLQFAADAGADFFHVSTAFVYSESHSSYDFKFNNYERSKRAAERAVRDSGLPYSIFRPSIIVGDSSTGHILRQQGIHLIINLYMRGYLPMIPGDPDCVCDFVPQDYVADAIIHSIRERHLGKEYWLTMGKRAMRIADMLQIGRKEARRLMHTELPKCRVVSQEMFDRLIRPVFLPAIPEQFRNIIDTALIFSRYLSMEHPFPSSYDELVASTPLSPLPAPAAVLRANVERWAIDAGLSQIHPESPSAASTINNQKVS